MEQHVCDTYVRILKNELIVALGCTEPIAIAYAGALARKVLGAMPQKVNVACSGNIVKNVKGVTVPNSGGLRGIKVAALLGITGGNAEKELAVLEGVTDDAREQTRSLLAAGVCTTSLVEGEENLVVIVTAGAGGHTALVEIRGTHTHVARVEKDGAVLQSSAAEGSAQETAPDKALLNVRDILTFAETADLTEIKPLLLRQVECNVAISYEGLRQGYGGEVGRTLLELYGTCCPVQVRAAAAAAAGSDARMNGCPMPVVINSGSGNQGITLTLPVVEYAKELHASSEMMLRALVLANLLSVHQKKYIGSLSAYCGATSAACAAGAAVCWMRGGGYEEICGAITNTLATLGGMLCDGAKSSCAEKIATAVQTALLAAAMSAHGRRFRHGDGIVTQDVEETIADIGYIAREGMRYADSEILRLMLEHE